MRAIHRLFVTTIFAAVIATATSGPAWADWPQFRGPEGDGRSNASGLPTSWGGVFERAAWQTDIPGRGWSSPVVLGDRAWVTTAEETALNEQALADKLARIPYGASQFRTHSAVTLLAIELDLTSGAMLRRIETLSVSDPAPIHTWNSYASPTPITDGELLICHYGALGTAAISLADGRVLWQRRLAFDDITGPGSSPVLWHNLVIIACDGIDQQCVVALDKLTGEEVWRTARPPIATEDAKHRRAFSTPLLIRHAGREQVVAPGAQWVASYDPASGRELWRVDCGVGGHATVPRPVYQDGVVYVCTGYMKPQLWAIRVDGEGDVSETHVVWKYTRQVPTISSPVIAGDAIYFVSEGGIASCVELATGSMRWQQRLEGSYSASPLAADGKLYFPNSEGTTFVLKPGPEYQEVARNQLRGHVKASFAVAGNALLIRSDPALYCIRPESGAAAE